MPDKPEELVHVPADLTLVSDAELETYGNSAVAEFDRINALEDVTNDTIQYGLRLADDIDRVRAEVAARNARAAQVAEASRAKLLKDQANLKARVHGTDTGEGGGAEGSVTTAPAVDAEAIAAAAARGATAALVSVLGDRVAGRALTQVSERATLSEARRFAPQTADVAPARLAVTASVDIPGVARGEGVDSLDRMVDIFQRKAKSMPVTNGNENRQLVASIRNEFEHTLDDRSSPAQVEELIRHLTSDEKKDSLVAAGGWCAPSEIRYDFFNIACEDGLIDLPTFGVSRGGIQFPISPSLADVFANSGNPAFGGFSTAFDQTAVPWLWTEFDDIQSATGSPTKPCIRVPCPTFDEERLECYGLCLTAGNLTDDAYPEATRNFLRLLMSAHAHAMNGRIIGHMVSRSDATIDTGSFAVTGQPVYQQVFGGLSLAAVDYRAQYGMCQNDVLEVVAPFWVKDVIRADMAWRNGTEARQIPDSEIVAQFAALNVRVQWVNDWQVRGANQFGNATEMDDWPTSAIFMVYAAGTFIKGNGLQLDLGVVRDSTLNSHNDHTAAWSEECHLVAKVGHSSKQYTINFCVNGKTGAQLSATAACTNL